MGQHARGTGRRRLAVGVVMVVVGAALAASSVASSSKVTTATAQQCGQDLKNVLRDPSGIVKTLPKAVQTTYNSWPFTVRATPWANFAGKKPPWKIGFISFPLGVPFQIDGLNQIKKDFAQAKAKGLVTGSLVTYVQPSNSTATPEQQIAAIQQMVRNGVDGILINPLAGPPLAPAIDAAGKARRTSCDDRLRNQRIEVLNQHLCQQQLACRRGCARSRQEGQHPHCARHRRKSESRPRLKRHMLPTSRRAPVPRLLGRSSANGAIRQPSRRRSSGSPPIQDSSYLLYCSTE